MKGGSVTGVSFEDEVLGEEATCFFTKAAAETGLVLEDSAPVNSICMLYIYIYVERERKRERETHTHTHTHIYI